MPAELSREQLSFVRDQVDEFNEEGECLVKRRLSPLRCTSATGRPE